MLASVVLNDLLLIDWMISKANASVNHCMSHCMSQFAVPFTLFGVNGIISGRCGIEGRKLYLTTYSSWNYTLIGAFVTSCFSLALYFASGSARTATTRERRVLLARRLFAVEFILLLAASAALLSAFLRHDFGLAYVTNYSSKGLSVFYLISGFWAGQEGTFLLWATVSGAF